MNDTIDLRIQIPKSSGYLDALMAMRCELEAQGSGRPYYVVPFLLTCAAALECVLREVLVDVVEREFEVPHKNLRSSLLSMNLRAKLTAVVPLSTRFQYRLSEKHDVYQALCELISLRNKVTHNESLYETIEVLRDTNANGEVYFQMDPETTGRFDDPTLGIETDVTRCHDALLLFLDLFVDAYRVPDFSGNSLVVTNQVDA